MRYLTIKAFKFSELSERAKENARENYRKEYECDQIPWADENSKSIRKICEALGSYYDIDSYNNVDISPSLSDEVMKLEGKRAYAYIWNNFIEPNLKGKYITNGYVGKDSVSYYSKVTKEFNCPFTGYCADMLLWDAWLEFKSDFKAYNGKIDVYGFFGRLERIIKHFLDEEERYYYSDEYAEEEIEAQGLEFNEDGEILCV